MAYRRKPFQPIPDFYDPLVAGSIDGTDRVPHDHGVIRAMNARYKTNVRVIGNPHYTIFVGRLSPWTSEETLRAHFDVYGEIKKLRLVRDVITGASRGYGFIEFWERKACDDAFNLSHKVVVDASEIIVDYECERLLPGWIPRRLGGGFGGRKESGQLRFGCRERPLREPIPIRRLGRRGSFSNDLRRPSRPVNGRVRRRSSGASPSREFRYRPERRRNSGPGASPPRELRNRSRRRDFLASPSREPPRNRARNRSH